MKKFLTAAVFAVLVFSCAVFAGVEEANKLFMERKYAEAEEAYRNLLPQLSGAEAAYVQFRIGESLLRQEKLEEAVAESLKVKEIEDAPPSMLGGAQVVAGGALLRLRKYDEAAEEFRKIREIKGASPHHLAEGGCLLGRILHRQKKYDEAIAELKKVREVQGAPERYIKEAEKLTELCVKAKESENE